VARLAVTWTYSDNLIESTQESIISESFADLLRLHDDKGKTAGSVSPEEARDVVVSVLGEHGVKTHLEAMAKQVILVIRRSQTFELTRRI